MTAPNAADSERKTVVFKVGALNLTGASELERRDQRQRRTNLDSQRSYRFVRHPIYSGIIGMFAATALVSGSCTHCSRSASSSPRTAEKIRLEEQHASTLFGKDYADYKKASWAIIPGLI